VAGRHMGTERGETVCTLDKAPWGRADHHSGRQTGAGGRKMTPLLFPLSTMRSTCAPGGAAGAGGTQPDRDRVEGGRLGWLTPAIGG